MYRQRNKLKAYTQQLVDSPTVKYQLPNGTGTNANNINISMKLVYLRSPVLGAGGKPGELTEKLMEASTDWKPNGEFTLSRHGA